MGTARSSAEITVIETIEKIVDGPIVEQFEGVDLTVAQEFVPQAEIVERFGEVPVKERAQTPMSSKVQEMVEEPLVEFFDDYAHFPAQKHRHVPTITKAQKPVEFTVFETIEKSVDVPVVKQAVGSQIQPIAKIAEIPLQIYM